MGGRPGVSEPSPSLNEGFSDPHRDEATSEGPGPRPSSRLVVAIVAPACPLVVRDPGRGVGEHNQPDVVGGLIGKASNEQRNAVAVRRAALGRQPQAEQAGPGVRRDPKRDSGRPVQPRRAEELVRDILTVGGKGTEVQHAVDDVAMAQELCAERRWGVHPCLDHRAWQVGRSVDVADQHILEEADHRRGPGPQVDGLGHEARLVEPSRHDALPGPQAPRPPVRGPPRADAGTVAVEVGHRRGRHGKARRR